nr:chaperone modulator CbpM [uncultured Arsenicibacter sp.]
MNTEHLISIREFCQYNQVEITFIEALEYNGLIETVIVEQVVYIHPEQLVRLEKLVRLHQDLAIHPDDLDVVTGLLERVEALQQQIVTLQNRLAFYEPL